MCSWSPSETSEQAPRRPPLRKSDRASCKERYARLCGRMGTVRQLGLLGVLRARCTFRRY
nr:hypothetical protein Q903MT_gene1389 [Picea sitchensis]